MTFTLTCDGPLDVDQTLARYRIWGEDPANRLSAGGFLRVARVGDRLHPYAVTWDGPRDDRRLQVTLAPATDAPGRSRDVKGHPDPFVVAAVRREVEHVFGLDADLPGFYRLAKGDPVLARLVGPLHGLRPSLSPTALEMLVGAVCAQQVNLTFAYALRARLVTRYGTACSLGDDQVHAFPDAAALAEAKVRDLRAMQFSERKAEYIIGIARAIRDGELEGDQLAMSDNDTVIATLTRLRGLGRWTAEWFLARCVGRGDVCPAGDLAVRKAFAHFYHRGRAVKDATIRRRARSWGPYQSLAVHYLLAGLRLSRASGGGS